MHFLHVQSLRIDEENLRTENRERERAMQQQKETSELALGALNEQLTVLTLDNKRKDAKMTKLQVWCLPASD